MARSKLTEDQWLALFAEERAGVTRRELVARYGVSRSAIGVQAAKRGLLKRQTGAPDHRCRPPGGWPEHEPLPQSAVGMTPADWRGLLERYVAGEPDADLALEFGVSTGAIHKQAEAMGYRKIDRLDAVYLTLRPDDRPESLQPTDVALIAARAGRAFCFDPGDPDATETQLTALGRTAAEQGRLSDFMALEKARRAALRWCAMPALSDRSFGPFDADDPAPASALILRPAQTPPSALPGGGPWSTWLFLGGRGAGKTLAGAGWLADQAQALGAGGRLALIGPTLHDVREVMIEGVSGLRSLPRWTPLDRPVFESSRRRLIFANGCIAYAFSAEDPDSLRGPQFSAAWADEFCAWPGAGARGAAETLALLRMGLRLPGADGAPPRLVVTTTPRPTRALITLRDEPTCALTHAGTAENADHLSPGFLQGLQALYGGTRREAQELDGKIVDLDGALFTAEMLALARSPSPSWGGTAAQQPGWGSMVHPATDARFTLPHPDRLPPIVPPHEGEGETIPPPFDRVIIAIDPTTTATGDACGIIAAASRLRPDGVREAVVLADRSMAGLSPDGWARRAAQAARDFDARAIVAEVNQGGEMVRQVLRTAGCALTVREVRATRGKRVRAEPVAALYEQGRVRHAPADGRRFDALEEELMAFGTDAEGSGSLDRADALVWAITDLLIDGGGERWKPRIRQL